MLVSATSGSAPADPEADRLQPQRRGTRAGGAQGLPILAREGALERRRAREPEGVLLRVLALVLERGHRGTQPRLETCVHAVRDGAVGDGAEAPVRGGEREEREREEPD